MAVQAVLFGRQVQPTDKYHACAGQILDMKDEDRRKRVSPNSTRDSIRLVGRRSQSEVKARHQQMFLSNDTARRWKPDKIAGKTTEGLLQAEATPRIPYQ